MEINYQHTKNQHGVAGPLAAIPLLFNSPFPGSLLDVGCGTGTWLMAAIRMGCIDFLGLDGIAIPSEQLLFPAEYFQMQDFNQPWDLKRKFDWAFCLEVAEHLSESAAEVLLDSLVRHSDAIFFSAACPKQAGQHHINCQWPVYWQRMFNQRGYICTDDVREKIWNLSEIEPWYKQNGFIARRDLKGAGKEPRLRSMIHPEMTRFLHEDSKVFIKHIELIERGCMPTHWYIILPVRAAWAKIIRFLKK